MIVFQITADGLSTFVKQELKVWIGLPGCLEVFHYFVKKICDKLFLSLMQHYIYILVGQAFDIFAQRYTADSSKVSSM